MPYVIIEMYCKKCESVQKIKSGFKTRCLNCMTIIDDEEELTDD